MTILIANIPIVFTKCRGTVLNYRCLYVFNIFNVLNREKKYHNYPILQMIKLKCRELKQLASHTAGAGGPRTQPLTLGQWHVWLTSCMMTVSLVRRKISPCETQGPPASLELFSLEVVVGCRWCSAVLSWSLKGTHLPQPSPCCVTQEVSSSVGLPEPRGTFPYRGPCRSPVWDPTAHSTWLGGGRPSMLGRG